MKNLCVCWILDNLIDILNCIYCSNVRKSKPVNIPLDASLKTLSHKKEFDPPYCLPYNCSRAVCEIGFFNGNLWLKIPKMHVKNPWEGNWGAQKFNVCCLFFSFYFLFNTIDFLRHAPCMLHVQNKYEECSKIYQETLTKIPEPSPNATDRALEEVCWYVHYTLDVFFFANPFFEFLNSQFSSFSASHTIH